MQRPTNATLEKQQLIALADARQLRRHGRLEDAEWAAAWNTRLRLTRERLTRKFELRTAA